jgi:hypothetical protein
MGEGVLFHQGEVLGSGIVTLREICLFQYYFDKGHPIGGLGALTENPLIRVSRSAACNHSRTVPGWSPKSGMA